MKLKGFTNEMRLAVLRSHAAEHGGRIEPRELVTAASNSDSEAYAIRDWFEWDDSIAGNEYRVQQAREFIRSVVLPPTKIVKGKDLGEIEIRPALVHRGDGHPGYIWTDGDDGERRLLEEFRRNVRGWRRNRVGAVLSDRAKKLTAQLLRELTRQIEGG